MKLSDIRRATLSLTLPLFCALHPVATVVVASQPLRSTTPIPSHDESSHRSFSLSHANRQRRLMRGIHEASSSPRAIPPLCVSGGATSLSDKSTSSSSTSLGKLRAFASTNFFLLGMVLAVSLARVFPHLGKNGGVLRPELLIGRFGVTCIFLLSGLSLELSELSAAIKNVKLNGLVQVASFGLWPALLGFPVTKLIAALVPDLFPQPLLDGLLILTCLPTTVNMCILLTSAAGGNVATALCNAVIGNLLGIFATPALLLRFFGTNIELLFVDMIAKLCNKVLVPVALGQALRATPMKMFYEDNSQRFKRLQEYILLGIVWNAFCNAFTKGMGIGIAQTAALLVLLPALHLTSVAGLFALFSSNAFKFTRGETVAAVLCGSHKTLAFGLPLISTVFEGSPNLAAYSAPIMIIHPLQLIIGFSLVPKLQKYIEADDGKKNY